jgi:biotin-dependent carboxylase-like uncharacterized protein
MSAALAVIAPGLGAALQDLGRVGYQAVGVPESGALDPVMLRLANWLAGNEDGEAALEMRFAGPSFEARGGSVRLAIAGEGAEIEMLAPHEGRIPAWRSVTIEAGHRFRVILRGGAPSYLAVEGGFDLPPALGSLSTLPVAGIGGFEGRALAAGDLLPLRLAQNSGGSERALRPPKFPPPETMRVIFGPQHDRFTAEASSILQGATYKVSQLSDRMGLRLEGPPLAHASGFDLISDGTAPGAIQVPGSGQPIVLLADRGTTGGYPKIATVITADLPLLGRLSPGAAVRFKAVTHAEAMGALRAHDAMLAALKAAIVPYRDPAEALMRALMEENIISGVTDAGS